MLIRDILGVPCTIRAYQRTIVRRRPIPDPQSDAWAQQRARELNGMGVSARTRRYRRDENLCVIYPLGFLREATRDVCQAVKGRKWSLL